jgi:hypothetical protein
MYKKDEAGNDLAYKGTYLTCLSFESDLDRIKAKFSPKEGT